MQGCGSGRPLRGRAVHPPAAPMARLSLLFDLDGTLTDSRPGIEATLRHAMAQVGAPLETAADLSGCVGPPLAEIFARLLGPARAALVPAAVRHYTRRYDEAGLFDNRVYDGIPAALEALAALPGGADLYVATSKATAVARRVLAHFGLTRHFRGVYGAAPDGSRAAKAGIIAAALADAGLTAAGTAMIGDREHDLLGARANAVRAVGVAWGFGSAAELRAAGAEAILQRPGELPDYFRPPRPAAGRPVAERAAP
jgi:phosphoglycolate phosphatase